jgi:myo-inositol-1(or 4)-monophosphatase
MLIKELTYSYPKINIIAEETGVIKNSDENIRWIIDPLDGTSNFVFSIPHFAISIALEKNNEVIVGGVYQPLTDEFFWAVKGRGAYCNNLRLRVSSKENLEDCMIGTGIPHKGMKGHEEYVPGLKQVMEKVCGIRRFGAASLDLAYVAAGKFDGYWEKNLKLVDIAAGSLIVKEAGGKVTDFDGKEDYLKSGRILASNFRIHEKLKKIIEL